MQTVTTAHISVSFALCWSFPRIKSNLIRPHCLYRGRSLKHLLRGPWRLFLTDLLLLLELVLPPTTQSIMANQVSLMSYLQHGPTALPRGMTQPGRNTRNRRYNAQDITDNFGLWQTFDLNTIQQQYGVLLATAQITDEPFPTSPPRLINSETALRSRVDSYLTPRVQRGLRCGFAHLTQTNQLGNMSVVDYDVGTLAETIEDFIPDTAYFDPQLPALNRPNRVPGDIKPSWKWSSSFRFQDNTVDEFKQALSQVNFYMQQHHARYGYILTDRELVAIRRRDRAGNLDLSLRIPWSRQGTAQQPTLTVLLALWYLGMLAATNGGLTGWYLH
jgi:hypothetical protein